MKINASHSDELILQMEVRQHEHGQVHIPGFNQLLDMLTCDTKAFDFFGFPGLYEVNKSDFMFFVYNFDVSFCHFPTYSNISQLWEHKRKI